jgi:VanZ like protein
VIAACTLRPAPAQLEEVARLHWYCVVCGDAGAADMLLNVLLFLPLGMLLRGNGWSGRRTVAFALTLSLAIEVSQGLFLVGRDASLGDVLTNSAGAWLGWHGYAALRASRPTGQQAVRAAAVLLLLMAALWLATGAGLQPSLTDTAPWIGQPMHAGRGPQPFPGTLQRATIDGIAIPNEPMGATAPWRDSIVIEIDATRASAERFAESIVLLRIVDTAHNVELAMDQRGDDAWLRLRVRASDWRLHNPRWLLSDAVRMMPGVPWRLQWRWLRGGFVLVSEPVSGAPGTPVAVPLSIGLGWAFIHPFVDTVGATRGLWTTLWLAWWFGLLGWFAAATGPKRQIVIGAIGLATFAGASLWWGLPVQLAELIAALVAFSAVGIAGKARR